MSASIVTQSSELCWTLVAPHEDNTSNKCYLEHYLLKKIYTTSTEYLMYICMYGNVNYIHVLFCECVQDHFVMTTNIIQDHVFMAKNVYSSIMVS